MVLVPHPSLSIPLYLHREPTVGTLKAKMTQEELKAFEIKELEDKLAKLKDNA